MVKKTIRNIPQARTAMPIQEAARRVCNFAEVTLGYSLADALNEAERCIMCPQQPCVKGCPVEIDIPGFIQKICDQQFRGAYDVLSEATLLPAICGRVCPQESQCEQVCIVGDHLEPVAIGRLERFVGDMALTESWSSEPYIEPNGRRVAIVGAGPAGIACAADMAKAGCEVVIFEALHRPGGVLSYGIPEFRLPNDIVAAEFGKVIELGVEVQCNTLVGRLFTIEQLRAEMGFDAVFIGTGAGYPKFMGIPGEALNGVLSANEFLTRCNLMQAGEFPHKDTPLHLGRKVVVIGAGNTAMDAMRVSLRLGAEEVHCLYRRSRAESPARVEEVDHAEEEGVNFQWLTAPVEILDDGDNNVRGLRCIRMELGEPDESGRRRPVPIEGSEYEYETDMVIYAIGTNANPIMGQTSTLEMNRWGYIEADDQQRTSLAGVFAGGDIVTGAATVILAMGAGRRAARSMKSYLRILDPVDMVVSDSERPRAFGIDVRQGNYRRVRAAA